MVLMFALSTLAVSSPVAAISFCSEPSEPYCVGGSVFFDDQYQFESCKREVESFVSGAENYVECLKREQSDTVEKVNALVEKFNCRARGESYC